MSLERYLDEDGNGIFASCLVRDILPINGERVDLLLLFESPHIEELQTYIPLSGGAGRAAFQVLLGAADAAEGLGSFISGLHVKGDSRVGIMNVSRVPLQLAAYDDHPSKHLVTRLDWARLEQMRTGRETYIDDILVREVQADSRQLNAGLQNRLSLVQYSSRATVVPAGKFAQRHWKSLSVRPDVSELSVPHPSNGWWTRATAPSDIANLSALRDLFSLRTS